MHENTNFSERFIRTLDGKQGWPHILLGIVYYLVPTLRRLVPFFLWIVWGIYALVLYGSNDSSRIQQSSNGPFMLVWHSWLQQVQCGQTVSKPASLIPACSKLLLVAAPCHLKVTRRILKQPGFAIMSVILMIVIVQQNKTEFIEAFHYSSSNIRYITNVDFSGYSCSPFYCASTCRIMYRFLFHTICETTYGLEETSGIKTLD